MSVHHPISRKTLALSALAAGLVAGFAPVAHAGSTVNGTVNATDLIYAAGSQSGFVSSVSGSTAPTGYTMIGVSSFTFSASGSITLNNATYNDADGGGAATSSSSNTGYGSISGISAPNAGYIVGVFVDAGGPEGNPPAALSYMTTDFTSASPLLDQTFFIGDGLTGDDSGSSQTFYVPTGATELYLGISDACGYSGSPSCYTDNYGAFSILIDETTSNSTPPVPEPGSLMLVGSGALAMAGALRRRFARA